MDRFTTVDGRLGMPGLSGVRVPPPFGTSRDIIETIDARRAAALTEDVIAALRAGIKTAVPTWRGRLTAVAIGVACTVAAALVGSYTGQRHWLQPAPEDIPASVAVQVAPPQPIEPQPASLIHAETATPILVESAAQSPKAASAASDVAANAKAAPAQTQAPIAAAPVAKRRTLARAVGRSVPKAKQSVVPSIEANTAWAKSDGISVPADTDSRPVAAYVAPGTPVRIELQRHTRLTD